DPLSVRNLMRAGVEEDHGWLFARTKSGYARMWPADIARSDPDLAREARQTLDGTYARAFTAWLRNLASGYAPSAAVGLLEGNYRAALLGGVDTAGGFLAPSEFAAEVLARVQAEAIVRSRATIRTTSRDALVFTHFRANASEPSTYSSGFVGGWVGEAPNQAAIDATFGQLSIPVKKLRVPAKLSRDLLDDADDILGALAQDAARNFSALEDAAFLAGDGIFSPLGVLNAGAPTVNVAGTVANTISNTTASAGSAPKMHDLVSALPSQYQRNAIMVMRSSTEGSIAKLVDGSGRYMFEREDADGDGVRELLGYPVANSPHLDAEGVAGARVILLGDFSQYVIAQRSMFTVQPLYERFADLDEIGLYISERLGGAPSTSDGWRIATV
ncbi:MAG: phage major capsid protein, partial [Chloroflexota bacterium]|nr:phage major capsid protein [Chloroflexota bacterium]